MEVKALSSRRLFLLCWGLATLAVVAYLLVSLTTTTIGFPLDDGWIHQVFARNLAQRGEFSYNPGQPVAGSTSPLWTLLLTPGYFFNGLSNSFYSWWTYGLGSLFLALTAHQAFLLTKKLGGNPTTALGAALFTLFEWRMVWAAASGMETIVFAFGTLFLVRYYLGDGGRGIFTAIDRMFTIKGLRAEDKKFSIFDFRFSIRKPSPQSSVLSPAFPPTPDPHPPSSSPQSSVLSPQSCLFLGFLGGLLTFVRPEGGVLLGLAGLDLGWRLRGEWTRLAKSWGLIVGGWLVVGGPYCLLNYALSGSILPNTFGAKSGFYGDFSLSGLLNYGWNGLNQLVFSGPVVLLVPGLLYCFRDFRRGNLDWRPLVWPPVLFLLYALRLPVTYHHGRYLMPLIPFLVIYGIIGTAGLMGWLRAQKLPMVARAVPLLLAFGLIFAGGSGALAYRFDVKFINDEQVTVGRWLATNTAPDALIATHDIGAIGYFSQRKLVDTAGLVSPEFVPIVRDQPAILKKLEDMKVNYFALLPTWYPDLYSELEKKPLKVFQPQETYLEEFGEKNMAVYKLR